MGLLQEPPRAYRSTSGAAAWWGGLVQLAPGPVRGLKGRAGGSRFGTLRSEGAGELGVGTSSVVGRFERPNTNRPDCPVLGVESLHWPCGQNARLEGGLTELADRASARTHSR